MPLIIPAFDQYQAPIVPLRGLWNAAPKEGDQMVNCEVDWLVTTKQTAVQFAFSGNSPVALSQIVALAIDNSRCGADVAFQFPDSNWELVVPAHNQLVSPVFTNALMFYANAPKAAVGDMTVFQVFNSMPPPVPIPGADAQNIAAPAGLPFGNGTTPVVPASVNGTLNSIAGNFVISTAGEAAELLLIDGTGRTLAYFFAEGAGPTPLTASGLSVRFQGGISCVISGSNVTAGGISLNLYYTTP